MNNNQPSPMQTAGQARGLGITAARIMWIIEAAGFASVIQPGKPPTASGRFIMEILAVGGDVVDVGAFACLPQPTLDPEARRFLDTFVGIFGPEASRWFADRAAKVGPGQRELYSENLAAGMFLLRVETISPAHMSVMLSVAPPGSLRVLGSLAARGPLAK